MDDRTRSRREGPQLGGQVVELFWSPGSTSSLRMKEFVEKSGVPYELVNLAESPDRLIELRAQGINASAARVGNRYVNGGNLDQVADLIGVPYNPPVILSPSALVAKYKTITDALKRVINQLPHELSTLKSPDQGRTVLGLAYHASSVMRMFLRDYNRDEWDCEDYHSVMHESRGTSDNVSGKDVVKQRLEDTVSRFWKWWEEYGEKDLMDRVISVYWGDHTLHEALEREVWHTAQHTRQLTSLLKEFGIEPDRPLSVKDLEGLPLPSGVYA